MNEENPNKGCGDYTLNISEEDLINIYVRKWVLKWCEKYHPEAFNEAKKFIKGLMQDEQEKT